MGTQNRAPYLSTQGVRRDKTTWPSDSPRILVSSGLKVLDSDHEGEEKSLVTQELTL